MHTSRIKRYHRLGPAMGSVAGALLLTVVVLAGCKPRHEVSTEKSAPPEPGAPAESAGVDREGQASEPKPKPGPASRPSPSPNSVVSPVPTDPADPPIAAPIPGAEIPQPNGPPLSRLQVLNKSRALAKCAWSKPSADCLTKLKGFLEASLSTEAAAREATLNWLTLPIAVELPGVVERVVHMVQADPSQAVRRSACRKMGRLRHPLIVAAASRYSLNRVSESDPGLYAACFTGLVELWASPHQLRAPIPEAYRFTIKRLGSTPRSAIVPPTAILHRLRKLPSPKPGTEHTAAQRKWLSQTRPYYSVADVTRAVESVASDPAVPWQTRLVAVEVLVHFATPVSRLKRLAESIATEQRTGTDGRPSEPLKSSHLGAIIKRLHQAMKPGP